MKQIKLARLFFESTNYIEVPAQCIKYINKINTRKVDEVYDGCFLRKEEPAQVEKCNSFSMGLIKTNELVFNLSNVIGNYIDAESILLTNKTLCQVELEFTDNTKEFFELRYKEVDGSNVYEHIYKAGNEIKICVRKP